MTVVQIVFFATLTLCLGCGGGTPAPAALDTANEQCGRCRMVLSEKRFASQLIAPYADPIFFDDMGCLASYLKATPDLPRGAVLYVADHRTGDWVRGDRAIFTRAVAVHGAMGSSVIAHASPSSRDSDPDATGGVPVEPAELFSGGRPAGGSR